ncbi:MAG TPA: EAL domain-containing protein [Gammaproteobacteria bacterium]|nr:EAL domain-containing protein [Gammaproteobacteria bacterium]
MPRLAFKLQSLRARLLAIAALAIIPLYVLFLYSAAEEREFAHQQALKQVAHVAEMLAEAQHGFVLDVRDILFRVLNNPATAPGGNRQRCQSLLSEVRGFENNLSFIGLANADGALYCSSPASQGTVNVADRTYFQTAIDKCQPALGQPQQGRVSGRNVIALAYPVCDEAGALEKVAIASTRIRWFAEAFSNQALPTNSEVSVIDLETGAIQLHYHNTISPPGAAVYDQKVPKALTQQLVANGRFDARQLEAASERIVMGVGLDHPGRPELSGLALIFRIPPESVYGAYNRLAAEQFTVLFVVTIGVLVAAWYGSTITIVHPVRSILQTMTRFAQGDLRARTGARSDGAELAQLGHAFDSMADRVSSQYRELVRMNRLYAVLSRINSAIVHAQERTDLADELCRALVDTGGFAAAVVYGRTGHGFLVRASAYHPELSWTALEHWQLSMDATFDTVQVYTHHDPNEPEDSPWSGVRAAGGQAVAYIPVVPHEEVEAVLVVAAMESEAFGPDEVDLLKELAGDYAFAIRFLEQRNRFHYLSYNDPLTRLPNRSSFEQRLQQSAEGPVELREHRILVLFRVDGFAQISSQLGRHTADAVLEHVGTRLRENRPPGVFVARIGDSEFAALAEGDDSQARADELLRYIEGAFPGETHMAGEDVFLSVSGGVLVGTSDLPENADPVQCAHTALDEAAGQNKRNSFRYYEPQMGTSNSRRHQMEHALRRAVDHGELRLHFQPQASLADGRLCGVEALLRWQDERLGPVSPAEFIPLAEEVGLMERIGEWVVENAVAQGAEWRRRGFSTGPIAVNISPRQLHGDSARHLSDLLDHHGLPAGDLELELTETALTDDPALMFERVRELREIGVKTAIDDFGTGYSSLAYLKEFDFDKLKIDKSFIDNLTRHPHDAAIARTIIAMGKSLQMQVLAEGVETEDQIYYLKRHGCDIIQGYLYSRPLPVSELEAFVQAEHRLELQQVDEGRSSETLLLVDGEQTFQETLLERLKQQGYRTLRAHSAEEAFTLLARHPVGVLVAGHQLPDMDGGEFLNRARELYPYSVRILLAGKTGLDAVMEAVNRGAVFKFLHRPADETTLVDEIQDAFAYHRQLIAGAASGLRTVTAGP